MTKISGVNGISYTYKGCPPHSGYYDGLLDIDEICNVLEGYFEKRIDKWFYFSNIESGMFEQEELKYYLRGIKLKVDNSLEIINSLDGKRIYSQKDMTKLMRDGVINPKTWAILETKNKKRYPVIVEAANKSSSVLVLFSTGLGYGYIRKLDNGEVLIIPDESYSKIIRDFYVHNIILANVIKGYDRFWHGHAFTLECLARDKFVPANKNKEQILKYYEHVIGVYKFLFRYLRYENKDNSKYYEAVKSIKVGLGWE